MLYDCEFVTISNVDCVYCCLLPLRTPLELAIDFILHDFEMAGVFLNM